MKNLILTLGLMVFFQSLNSIKAEIKILYPHELPTGPNYDNGVITVRATTVNNFGPFDLELFKEGHK